jgi:hypothetical protein
MVIISGGTLRLFSGRMGARIEKPRSGFFPDRGSVILADQSHSPLIACNALDVFLR